MFDLISKYFWMMAVAVTAINAMVLRQKARKHIKENPSLEEGYSVLFRRYLYWMNIPWVVMGVGCTIGGVPSVWHYFRPQDGNPYVLAWFGSVFLLWIVATIWLFLRGGAELLATHPGVLIVTYGFRSKELTNPAAIKLLWLLILAAGILAVAAMWFMDLPTPKFH